jgi:phosphoribosylformylglycinamidine (FGAM) synthase PurS component
MHGTYLIEVTSKRGVKDTTAAEVQSQFRHLGIRAHCKVATSKLYRLIGQMSTEQRARVGRDLLADPIIEEAHDGGWKPKEPLTGNARKLPQAKSVVVDVWYKQGVTDAVGESVLKGLRDMNLDEISDVRTGMRYRFLGLKDKRVAEKLALAALMNPLIHDRIIHAD